MVEWVRSLRYTLSKTIRWGMAEPSALSPLALLATDEPHGASLPTSRNASATLAGWQQPDGSIGISKDQPKPGWPTALAILLWRAAGQHESNAKRALSWLRQRQGQAVPRNKVFGHDTTIPGFPWVEGTHGWVEPTAWAVLALHAAGGPTAKPRVEEGLRLIRDRATPLGGWNCGNSTVFGVPIRPQPDLTGLALLALAVEKKPDEKIEKALRYLEARLPEIRAPRSLSWGILGLEAWGRRPAGADAWLEEAAKRVSPEANLRQAELLLAAGGKRTRALLGLEPTP